VREPTSVRGALLIYGALLRLCARGADAADRAEMRRTCRDACRAAVRQGGWPALVRRLSVEVADLAGARLGGRLWRRGRVSEARRRRAPAASGWRALATELRYGVRALRARRADTVLSVLLLGVGLATASTVFGVADSLLIHPVPFPDPGALAQIFSVQPQTRFATPSMPIGLARRWLERGDLFASGGVHLTTSAIVTSGDRSDLVAAAYVSPGLFETLGVRPEAGRTFAPEEGRAGTERVAIISDETWAEHFGRSPAAIGHTLRIDDVDYTVVGVMPADFRFPFAAQRLWLPLSVTRPPPAFARRLCTLTVRVRSGLSRDALTQAIQAAGPAMAKQALQPWPYGGSARFLDQVFMDDSTRRSIWLLFGATLLLLMTVCANVANIGMSQVFARTRDLAICSALGATRMRLVRQAVLEQLLLGVLALAAAVPITAAGLRLARALLPASFTFSSLTVIGLGPRVVIMLGALALLAPLLAGLVPALTGSRAAVADTLRLESRSSTGTRGARLFRQALVATEIACSVTLLVSTALLIRSFVRMEHTDVGFDTRHLISVSLAFPAARFPTGVSQDLYVDHAAGAIGRIPGVRAVSLTDGIPPVNGSIVFGSIEAEGEAHPLDGIVASGYTVAPDFFTTIGLPLLQGRAFTSDDDSDQVIVSQSLAAQLWPGQGAVGRRFRWTDDASWSTVIGVAATARESFDASRQLPQVYHLRRPHAPAPPPPSRGAIAAYARIAVRVSDEASAIPRIRDALRATDSGVLVQGVERVDDLFAQGLDRPRFLLALMIVFAAAGLVLAAVGIYGVLSCLVSQQQREIGIRLVLGAEPRRIGRAVVRGALTTTALGLVAGLAAAAAAGRILGSLLFDIDAHDVASYAGVALLVLAAAAASAWRPARRAMRVDPIGLLRNE
jgi:putative ABC transport system permease protein